MGMCLTLQLELLGAEVRVFDPTGLPMKDDTSEKHEKVVELRSLCIWSEGQMWVSPEQHGTVTGVFKNQIDWIPLEVGSVRPSQGRTLGIAQVGPGFPSINISACSCCKYVHAVYQTLSW